MKYLVLVSLVMVVLALAALPALAQEPVNICPDGLVPWQETTPLPFPGYGMGTASYSGTIYAIGGNAGGVTSTVVYAGVLPDGTLSQWQHTTPLNYPRTLAQAVVISDTLYISSTDVLTSEKAAINPDGSLEPWEPTTDTVDYDQVPESGYYYRVDYQTGLVERSTNAVTWQPVNKHPGKPYFPGIVEAGNYLYVLGGHVGVLTSTVMYWDTTTPPTPSDYGLTINDGQLFTNQVSVTLTIGQPPMWDKLVQVSNDGGFSGATWQTYHPCKEWQITSYGSSVIPRTVYARWKDLETGEIFGPVSDDIIWDGRPPEGTVKIEDGVQPASQAARAAGAVEVQGEADYVVYVMAVQKAGAEPNVTLVLAASDDVSGVAEMRISTEPGGGAWQPYREEIPWYLEDGGVVFVQFKDWAGNVSKVVSAGR